MSTYVVDASVAVKWFLEEAHTPEALGLLSNTNQLHAPDFLLVEVASVVCQRIQRGQLLPEPGQQVLPALRLLPIQIAPTTDLLDSAVAIAMSTATSLYDSLYLALAALVEARMVTADRRLFLKLLRGSFGDRVLWVGDLS